MPYASAPEPKSGTNIRGSRTRGNATQNENVVPKAELDLTSQKSAANNNRRATRNKSRKPNEKASGNATE